MATAKTPAICREEILFFGLDHFETYWTFLHEYLFEGMDFDNSNVCEFEGFVITKHEVKKYVYKMVFTKDSHPIFAFFKGRKGPISTKDYLCVYSSAFRILWTDAVLGFVYAHFEPTRIRRFDIALDLARPTVEVTAHFPTPNQKWSEIHGADGKIETLYIGELKNTANKFKLVRVYDKIADTLKKSKGSTYAEYLALPHVTRMEVEIRTELARNARLDKLDSKEYLFGVFKRYLGGHTDLLDNLEAEEVPLYVKRQDIDPEIIQSTAYRQQRTKLFLSYAGELYLRGICPVELLLFEGIVSERTKKALWYENYVQHYGETARLKRENAKKLRKSKRNADGP